MILKSKTNEQLHALIKDAAQSEKNATLVLLEYLSEVAERRLFAIYGYGSLWEYVHKELNYSEAQTSDRISAMYAMKKLPEIKTEIETGNLSLTTAAKLGSHIRRERLTLEDTKSLLSEISGKTTREVERLLVANSTDPKRADTARAISPSLTRITLDVDQEFLNMIEQIKTLKSNLGLSIQEVFAVAMKEMITGSNAKSEKLQKKVLKQTKPIESLRAPEVKLSSRYIKVKDKVFVKVRAANQCEYVSEVTGKRCSSKHQLQIDHIYPYAKGGSNAVENLRYYCRTHNLLRAIEEYGPEKISRHVEIK